MNFQDYGIEVVDYLRPTTYEDKRFHLDWDLDTFKDMDKAANIAKGVIESNGKIALVTDYDCDGLTSAVVLTRYFTTILNYKNTVTLTNRRTQGNGINSVLLQQILEEHDKSPIALVITADHGAGNNKEFGILEKSKNIRVIYTDHHHIPADNYPSNASAVINVMREDNNFHNGFKGISGCHTALLLCAAIHRALGYDLKDLNPLLFYSGLSTVVDQMPMTSDYNRALVRAGMRTFDFRADEGEKLIREKLDIPAMPKQKQLSWTIGPFINSGNRCGTESAVFSGICYGREDALSYALQENRRKKNNQKEVIEAATSSIHKVYGSKLYDQFGLIVEIDTDYGIAGPVANSIGDTFNRPTIAFRANPDETVLMGSGRGIWPELNLLEVLDKIKQKHSDIIIKAAGHKGACGIEIYASKIGIFRKVFSDTIQEMVGGKIPKSILKVLPIEGKDIHLGLALKIEEYGPYGNGLDAPVLMSRLKLKKSYPLGTNGRGCVFERVGKSTISGVYFFERDNGVTPDNWNDKMEVDQYYYVVYDYQLDYRNKNYGGSMFIKDIIKDV